VVHLEVVAWDVLKTQEPFVIAAAVFSAVFFRGCRVALGLALAVLVFFQVATFLGG
jgi:hypothetical protein